MGYGFSQGQLEEFRNSEKVEILAKSAHLDLHKNTCNSGWKSNGATAFGSLFSQGTMLDVRAPGRPGEQFLRSENHSNW